MALGAAAGAGRDRGDRAGRLQPTCRHRRPWRAQCLSLPPRAAGRLDRPADTLKRWFRSGCQRSSRKAAGAAAATSLNVFPVSAELPVLPGVLRRHASEKLREFDAGQASARLIRSRPCVSPPPGMAPWWPMPCGALDGPMGSKAAQPEARTQLLKAAPPRGCRRLMGLAWAQPASLLINLPAHSPDRH